MIDITVFTSQGIVPYRAQWVEFNTNPRNANKYRVKFLYNIFSDVHSRMTGYFKVERFTLQNGAYDLDISYVFDSIAESSTFVDKNGNLLSPTIEDENGENMPNPDLWGTEFDFMAVLFAAPIPDNNIVDGYTQILFNRGSFDFPKNREV